MSETHEERQQRIRFENLVMRNRNPVAAGSRILEALTSYGYSELTPNDKGHNPPEGVMCRGAASVLRAVAVALSHEYPDADGEWGGPMLSQIEFTTQDAVIALSMMAQYLDYGSQLVDDVRSARLDDESEASK